MEETARRIGNPQQKLPPPHSPGRARGALSPRAEPSLEINETGGPWAELEFGPAEREKKQGKGPKTISNRKIPKVTTLFSPQASDGSEGHLETTSENDEDVKPTLIWSCVYGQEITQGTSGSLLSCPMPDASLDYRNILESTKKLFVDICPNVEFLPRKAAPVYADDDSDSAE